MDVNSTAGKYRTIVADPPWPYKGEEPPLRLTQSGRRERGHVGQYRHMPLAAISALSPPAELDAHLYLWTTNAFMVEAHDVARAWGFTPKTICTWGKVQANGSPSRKTGYWFRGATEHCLFCVRGSLRLQRSDAVSTLWLWPRIFTHSTKPDAFYDLVQSCSPGPYLEMFSRRARLGWDCWGDEALNHIEIGAA